MERSALAAQGVRLGVGEGVLGGGFDLFLLGEGMGGLVDGPADSDEFVQSSKSVCTFYL